MSTPSAWRQFNFFTASPVKDAHDLASPPETFKNVSDIACIAQSSQGLLVADHHGNILLLDSDFEVSKRWVAHENGHVTHLVEKRGILITLIEEVGIRYPILKIWDLEHTSNAGPPLLRSAKIQTGTRPHPVSTIALSQGISHLAIGLADGTVLFFRNLDQYLFSNSNALNHLPKPKTILEASGDSVTGLGFREPMHEPHTHEQGAPQTAASAHARLPSALEDPTNENLYLFIVTLSQFLTYQVTGKGTGQPPIEVDELGADSGCATMNTKATDMIIARSEALYLEHVDGRGPSFAVEGPKTSVLSHKGYAVIISPPITPSAFSGSATVRKRAVEGVKDDVTRILVFDMDNRFIAFSDTFREEIKTVFTCWGGLYVLTNKSTLYRLNEASTSTKLDTFFARANYALAVSMAHNQGLDSAAIADIYRRYGDQFYNSGDHEGAMDQYIKTIGEVQPSYVIRKYLDAQRIQCLVEYLQELHTRGLANSDHTTLLLNAYTKMKDVARLDDFIKAAEGISDNADERRIKGDRAEKPPRKDLPFDLETVIRVCRQAGYFSHAVYLARRYERHEDYLRIQIEDAGNYKDALEYVRKLGSAASESNLTRYGRILLEKLPEETTQLLIDICTGSGFVTHTVSEAQAQAQDQNSKNQAANSGPSYLSYLAYNRKETSGGGDGTSTAAGTGKDSSTGVAEIDKDPGIAVVAAGIAAGMAPAVVGASAIEQGQRKRQSTTRASVHSGSRAPSPPLTAALIPGAKFKVPVRRPSPRVYFAHFVDHPDHFVRFLEAIAWNRWGQKVDVKQGAIEDKKTAGLSTAAEDPFLDEESNKADHMAVWNTLMELYLTLSTSALSKSPPDEETAKVSKAKALHVLRSPFEYDPTHALLVCSTRRFIDGLILLWEKLGMYEDILRFWMDLENTPTPTKEDAEAAGVGKVQPSSEVLKYLKRYGGSNPNLYPLVLRFLTSTPALLQKHTNELTGILEHIEQEKIMPPLAVVQVLSRNGVASVGLVKEWVMRRIKESREEINSDRRLIDSYRAETAAKLKDIAELSNPDAPRVFHVTKCSSCDGGLELPVVHFMCKHSYHQRCLGEHEDECPVCARQHGIIRQIRRENQRMADQHDVFLADVEENGFSAIATAFSQGIMGVPSTLQS